MIRVRTKVRRGELGGINRQKVLSVRLNYIQPLPLSIISVGSHVTSCGVSFIRTDDWLGDKTGGWRPPLSIAVGGSPSQEASEGRSSPAAAPLPCITTQLTLRCFSTGDADYPTDLEIWFQIINTLYQVVASLHWLHIYDKWKKNVYIFSFYFIFGLFMSELPIHTSKIPNKTYRSTKRVFILF